MAARQKCGGVCTTRVVAFAPFLPRAERCEHPLYERAGNPMSPKVAKIESRPGAGTSVTGTLRVHPGAEVPA